MYTYIYIYIYTHTYTYTQEDEHQNPTASPEPLPPTNHSQSLQNLVAVSPKQQWDLIIVATVPKGFCNRSLVRVRTCAFRFLTVRLRLQGFPFRDQRLQ